MNVLNSEEENRRKTKKWKMRENKKYPYRNKKRELEKMKKQTNKTAILGILLVFTLMFSMVGVLAQGQNKFIANNKYTETQMKQIQNQFQKQYQFNCTGECTYSESGDNFQLEVREQKRLFNFINLDAKETYILDAEGNLIQARYNIWSRLLNQERIRI